MKSKISSYLKSILILIIFMILNLAISFSIQFLLHTNQITMNNFKLLLSLNFIIPTIIIYLIFFRKIKVYYYLQNNIFFYIIIILLSFSIQIIGTIIEIWSMSFIPDPYKNYYEQLKELLYPDNLIDLIFTLVSVGLIAPICEELLFRGFLLDYLLRYNNFLISNIFQSILFGIAHMNPFQLLYAIPIGFLFGWFYYKTKNFLIPILLHIATNTISVILSVVEIHNPFLKEFLHFGSNASSIHELPSPPIFVSIVILVLSIFVLPKINKN